MAAWLDALEPQLRAIVELLRATVRDAAPHAVEAIKWNQLVFANARNFAFVNVAKAHVVFGFFDGSVIVDPEALLSGDGKRMRSLRVRVGDAPPLAAIRVWLPHAIANAATQSKSTRPRS